MLCRAAVYAGSLEERIFQRQLVKRRVLATAIGSEDAAADGALTTDVLSTASVDPRGAALVQARDRSRQSRDHFSAQRRHHDRLVSLSSFS